MLACSFHLFINSLSDEMTYNPENKLSGEAQNIERWWETYERCDPNDQSLFVWETPPNPWNNSLLEFKNTFLLNYTGVSSAYINRIYFRLDR